jgi:hypothetical protein
MYLKGLIVAAKPVKIKYSTKLACNYESVADVSRIKIIPDYTNLISDFQSDLFYVLCCVSRLMRQHQYGLSSKNEYLMFRLKLDILRKITVKGLNLKFTEYKYVSKF